MAKRLTLSIMGALAVLAGPLPVLASVKDGVDAWSRGEWDRAVGEWRGPAEAGDPDAMFNLGQAYRLGRGVPQDNALAESYYQRAAQGGHVLAADTYGLLLFQDGRREQALPYVSAAAGRGDPRAQYLMGIAYFNGDLVERDWERAYALLILANGQGLPQVAPALAEMDRHIPLDQRQQAASLAVTMQQQADATRAREMAAAELAMAGPPAKPQPQIAVASPVQSETPRVPQPIASIELEPSVQAARLAVREVMVATGTEDPGEAGADYARPASAPLQDQLAVAPAQPPAPQQPSPSQPFAQTSSAEPTAAQPARSSGPWKVQLGAFSVRANAERLWNQLRTRQELFGRTPLMVASGSLTRLQAGGFATRAEAQTACAALERSGQPCIVTQ